MSGSMNNAGNKKMVVFDFDGVFVDSLDLWFNINKSNNPHLTYNHHRQMSLGNFFESYESENPIVQFTPHPDYYSEYREGLVHLPIIDGFKDLILTLSNDYRLAVVSSGPENHIKEYLKLQEIHHLFDEVMGVETHKSKTYKLNHLLEKYSYDPSHSVFVTDTLGDIIEANAVQIQSIGVLWGLHDRKTLEKGNPVKIVDSTDKLLSQIKIMI